MRTHKIYFPCGSSKQERVETTAQAPLSRESDAITSTELIIPTKDKSSINAYLATPKEGTDDIETGVVLYTDILGFDNEDTRKVADLLASHSIPTIVPDLYRGNPWPNKPLDDTLSAWFELHPLDRIRDDIKATVDALRDRGFGTRLGLVGFCFGGGRVLDEISLADEGVNPTTAVAFYPTGFNPVDVGSNSKCPLLFIAGTTDDFVPMNDVENLRSTLETKNTVMGDCQMIIVEGAGHSFVHHPKSDDDKIDSASLLSTAVQWLKKHLEE